MRHYKRPVIKYVHTFIPGVLAGILLLLMLPTTARATANATLTLSPSSQMVAAGSDLVINVSLNTAGASVNTVQSELSYPSANFSFVSLTANAPFNGAFPTPITSTSGGNNLIDFAAGTTTPFSGTQNVVTLTLKATTNGATLPVTLAAVCAANSYATNCSAAYDASSSANDLATVTSGSYAVDTPPTASLSSPSSGGTVNGTAVVSGSVTDNSGSGLSDVKIQAQDNTGNSNDPHNGQTITVCDPATNSSGSTYQCNWDTTGYYNGSYSLQMVAVDNDGGSTTTASVSVTVSNPAPTVTLSDSATNNAVTAGGTTNLTWTSANNPAACTASNSSGSSDWTGAKSVTNSSGVTVTPVAPSTTYHLQCSGPSGTSSVSSVTVTVLSAPTITITAPSNGASVGGVVTINASASATAPATVHDVQFQVDGVNISGCDPTAPVSGSTYTCNTWDTTALSNASHTIKAVITDNYSQTAASTETVNVDNVCAAPSAPTGVSETGSTYTAIDLNWTASTPGSGCTIASYTIYRDGVKVGTSSIPTYTDTGLTASNTYSYTVQAVDNADDSSAQSSSADLATAVDNEPPSIPANLRLTLDGPNNIDLGWSASSENPNLGGIAIDHYSVWRALINNGVTGSYSALGNTATGSTLSYTDNGVSNSVSTSYSYEVGAVDAVNSSDLSTPVVGSTLACTLSGSVTTCNLPNGTDLSDMDAIVVANETLVNDGKVCNTTVSGGVLKGSGTTCDLTISAGGTVSPGHSPGLLTVNGNYSQAGTYDVELQSPGVTPGTDYDQIDVYGTVNVAGGSLAVNFLNGFNPTVGQVFTILKNNGAQPVSGTYAGLAEGAVFAVNDTKLQISYKGGDGNDIALTAVNPDTPVTATVPQAPNTGLALVAANPLVSGIVTLAVTAGLRLLRQKHKVL